MNEVYRYCNYPKQAFHQRMDRVLVEQEQHLLLLPIIAELRLEHPGVGARQLYHILKPEGIGRDKFEQLCFSNGYKLSRKRAFTRTTDSTGVIRFPNLTLDVELTQINQAWGSDITYYQVGKTFHYLTFIIDLYSRFIVGYSVSKRLLTSETTMPALQAAIKKRMPAKGLIFHSDGGGQYYCKEFLALTTHYQISNSMCDMAYENPYAERINGTIKNQYLKGYNPQSFPDLIKKTERAVNNYNFIRPHKSLNKQTPAGFEKQVPAGGTSLLNDDLSLGRVINLDNQANHHSPKSLNQKNYENPVLKTVNVFQA
jgi:putative transposase